jgi:hypothetical protein
MMRFILDYQMVCGGSIGESARVVDSLRIALKCEVSGCARPCHGLKSVVDCASERGRGLHRALGRP